VNWLGDRVRGALNHAVEQVIWGAVVLLAVALLVILGSIFTWGNVPWIVALLVLAALTVWASSRARNSSQRSAAAERDLKATRDSLEAARSRAESLQEELEGVQEDLAAVFMDLELTLSAADLIYEALETLQKIVRGALPGVTIDELIEQGLLEPARQFLERGGGEEVRLSVLVPDGTDFLMRWAAGHRLESKRRFRHAINTTFSRIAFETGQIAYSADVADDPRFEPFPEATRHYRSLISVPIRAGDDVVAVLNVLSTFPHAFFEPDLAFVKLVGAVLDFVWVTVLLPSE
jgi:hypothetical protein